MRIPSSRAGLWTLVLGVALLGASAPAPGALAASDRQDGYAQLIVVGFVTLAGVPSIIYFGAGVPGEMVRGPIFADEAATSASAATFIAIVRTNSSTGYALMCMTSDMRSYASIDIISARQIAYAITVQDRGQADGGTVVDTDATLRLAHSDVHSDAAGDRYAVLPSLTVPFVLSGTYQGVATFVVVEL